VFYTPSVQGYEGRIRNEVLTRRELQISVILEEEADSSAKAAARSDGAEGAYDRFFYGLEGRKREYRAPKGEILTFSPGGKGRDEWTKRLDSGKPEALLSVRNMIMEKAEILRHHRVLVWGADDGLLVWDAGRRTPEGYTAGLCRRAESKTVLEQYAATLEELDRPQLAVFPSQTVTDNPFGVSFDRILARDPAQTADELLAFAQAARAYAADGATLCFSARIPSRGMRLSRLIDPADPLRELISAAEDALYRDASIPLFCWDAAELARIFSAAGLSCRTDTARIAETRRLSPADLDRWFDEERSPWAAAIISGAGAEAAAEFRAKLDRIARAGPCAWDYEILLCVVVY
jgi:putative ATPase